MKFENPVLPGMHPDPTVCRVGGDFYLACSSFEHFPGVPLFHSRDLVAWRPIGHALTRAGQLDLTGAPSSGGIYAPTLRHHDGRFYLVTTLVGRGNFVVIADDPRGPWSDPHWLDDEGFDPSLAFLDERVHYTRTGPGADEDHPFVYQSELVLSDAGPAIAETPRAIWRGTGGVWSEGPHLYRRGRWFYLVTAEGGTSYGHSVVVARSTGPDGPFEASPHGPLVTHRDRPRHPIQAVGHADLVELSDGSIWAVLLGIRPTDGRHHHLGRETFLAPVEWGDDGWPRMPALELSVARPSLPSDSADTVPMSDPDDFRSPALGPSWMFVRNPPEDAWSLDERPGCLRLWGCPATLGDVAPLALVCRRQQHFGLAVRTLLDFTPDRPNEQAGLCVRATEAFHAVLLVGSGRRGRELTLVHTTGGRSRTLGRVDLEEGPVTLVLEATPRAYRFLGGTGGRLDDLGSVPTRSFSAETILERSGRHHFTGATIGLLATGNGSRSTVPADFQRFDYVPDPKSAGGRGAYRRT
jgi:alpha-N-arabinofuranosidase